MKPAVGWPAFLVTVVALLVAVGGLIDAAWIISDIVFLPLVLTAILVGTALAHTSAASWRGALFLVLTGILVAANAASQFAPPLAGAIGELGRATVWLAMRLWQRSRIGYLALPADRPLAWPAFVQLNESRVRLVRLGQHLAIWGRGLWTGQIEPNPQAFLFVAGLLLWGCVTWAMWMVLRRRNPLAAMAPLGGVLALSTYLSDASLGYLLGFAGCAVVLQPIVRLSWHERRWQQKGLDYSTEVQFDTWQAAIAITATILVLASITPAVNTPRLTNVLWRTISQPQELVAEFLTRLFARVEPVSTSEMPQVDGLARGFETARSGLPRAHLLGQPPNLSERTVMSVCIDAPSPALDESSDRLIGPRTYWRGTTYARFDGTKWFNDPGFTVDLGPYELVTPGLVFTPTKLLRQRYLVQQPYGTTLYAVGEPQFVDQPVQIRRRNNNDVIALQGISGDYAVLSQVPVASAGQLRAASEQVPVQISKVYLTLSPTVSERVLRLAAEIVQETTTGYDRARAIEAYLRRFPYDLQIPSPPAGRDAVGYFLFELQRGYCDYYASSFVVLARAVGLPSRLAVGYATGEYNPENGCYTVTEMDAHSWPEVYFAEHGWIPFEPTASFSWLERPPDSDSQPEWVAEADVPDRPAGPGLPAGSGLPARTWHVAARIWWQRMRANWRRYPVLALGLTLPLLLVIGWWRRWRVQHLAPRQGIALVYDRMSQAGSRLERARQPHETPAEYGAWLAQAIDARMARWPWSKRCRPGLSAQVREGVAALCEAYARASYSAGPVLPSDRRRIESRWRRLRWQMTWLWLISRRT